MAAALSYGRPASSLKPGSHGRRQPSESLYSMFEDHQVRQFKEAFSMIDQDSDGIIDEKDLKEMLTTLGKPPTSSQIASLMESAQKQPNGRRGINFTQFLTMMADHLLALDPEAELREAFESFEETDRGVLNGKELRKWLAEVGDRMSPAEIDAFLSPPFTDRHTNFQYNKFLDMLRISDANEAEMR